jgi:hypothetical protein
MIIGLSGYAQSGKDSVANILVEKYNFTRVAFADPIRNLLWDLNPVLKTDYTLQGIVSAYGWDVAKTQFPEVRRLLQELGVSARKRLGEDIWVIAALHEMDDATKNYVITDVRFENEAVMIRQLGGELWRIQRPGVEAVNRHISETALDKYKWDRVLDNEGTLKDLELVVQTRVEPLLNANKVN